MSVKFNSSGGGSVTLDAPSTASNLTVTLPSASGTLVSTGSPFSGGTANGVVYLNGSSVPTTGSALTFNGTTLGVNADGVGLNITRGSSVGFLYHDGNAGAANLTLQSQNGSVRLLTEAGSGGTIKMFVEGSEQMRLTSTGLGIGTSSPASKLNVASTNPVFTLTRSDNASTPSAAINFSATSNVKWQIGTNQAIGAGLEFNAGNGTNNYMYLDTSGNLGIGTSSPATKLHVAASGPTVRIDGTPAGNSGAKLQFLGWANTATNWQLDVASIGGAGLEFVPSTAAGGSTFTTPAFTMYNNGVFTVTSGVQFPATQSASSDANTLDDYEEGSWSPVITPQSGAFGSVTYNGANVGYYTKIGNVVSVTAIPYVTAYTVGSGSGQMKISLPFPVKDVTQNYPVGVVSQYGGAGYTPSLTSAMVTARGNQNSAVFLLRADNNTNTADETISAFSTSGFYFRVTMVYLTD